MLVNAPPALAASLVSSSSSSAATEAAAFRYDGATATLHVALPPLPTANATHTVSVVFACPDDGDGSGDGDDGATCDADVVDAALSGVRGAITRARTAKALLDEARVCPGDSDPSGGVLQRLATTGAVLTHLAASAAAGGDGGINRDGDDDATALFWQTVDELPARVADATREIGALDGAALEGSINAARLARARALLTAAAGDLAA